MEGSQNFLDQFDSTTEEEEEVPKDEDPSDIGTHLESFERSSGKLGLKKVERQTLENKKLERMKQKEVGEETTSPSPVYKPKREGRKLFESPASGVAVMSSPGSAITDATVVLPALHAARFRWPWLT